MDSNPLRPIVCRNYPVDVSVKLVYGTGDPATVKGVACSSAFVEPRMSTNTTKVASAMKLDYDSMTCSIR